MKINCGPTWAEKKAALEQWHPWFAWRPVRVGSGDCRWLETIERKGTYWAAYNYAVWEWHYRAKDTDHSAE